jgi:uncharacterized membrane protein YeiH
MDMFGFAAMGLVSGLGGGIIRDVLLEHGTPAALVDPAYIPTALAGAAIAFLMHIQSRAWNRVFLLVDAAAISLWATAGALKTLGDGLEWLPAVLLGTITAIGGGVSRDLMLQRVPAVFKDGQLYATVAIVVAGIQVIFAEAYGTRFFTGTVVAIGVGFALRLVAYWRGWRLPTGLDWEPSKILQRVAKPRGSADPPEPDAR